MRFTKMHGLGNDFIIIEESEIPQNTDLSNLAISMCNRYTGVGADGILLISRSNVADLKMTIVNSDGSYAEMCGNGIRCVAKYAFEKGIVNNESFSIETLSGIMKPEVYTTSGKTVSSVKVNMGQPKFNTRDIPASSDNENIFDYPLLVNGQQYKVTSLLLGVPHTVLFIDNLDEIDIKATGSAIEKSAMFPKGTNVNFVEAVAPYELKVRTWERGAGYTMACGTGACASAVAYCWFNKTKNVIKTDLRLGQLLIDWSNDNNVYMTGPAAISFDGELDLDQLGN